MRHIEALVLLCTAVIPILGAEPSRPRGVGPEFAKFYKSKETFQCITTPSIILPKSAINDDYCDCPDGSDEPGTSACTFLSPLSPLQPVSGSISGTSNVTVALPGFYCKNKGHVPAYVPFSFVNDGVCDWEVCCDGSDEWAGAGGVRCEDRCAATGKEHRKKEAEREKASLAAGKRRAEMVREAAQVKSGLRQKLDVLGKEIQDIQFKVNDAKKKYDDIERRERGKVLTGASEKATRVTILAGLAKRRVEELREALVETVQKRDAAREKVEALEGILQTFKEEYNPNFNDEGVKRAVKAWEDYAAQRDSGDATVAAADRDVDEISKPDSETEGINWAEWELEEEDSDVDILYRFEEYLPPTIRTWVHIKLRDLRVLLIENGILADNANSGQESRLVTAAREAHQALEKDLSDKTSQSSTLTADIDKDYGPDDVFLALKDQCITQDAGEYTYELCWLSKTTQKSKKGGSHTGLGNFAGFDTVVVDDEVGPDGKGLGSGERIALKYENGQHCWNGPNRATTVIVACAERDEIWKVAEMEKCVYRMEVGSPAACDAPTGPTGPAAAAGKRTAAAAGKNKNEL